MKKRFILPLFTLSFVLCLLCIHTILYAQDFSRKCELPDSLSSPLDFFHTKIFSSWSFPDIDKDGQSPCGYVYSAGHEGTDIGIKRKEMKDGVNVYAAADGVVLWAFDGKYDRCGSTNDHPDCADPKRKLSANLNEGNTVCTGYGPYCKDGGQGCYWCFAGGNLVVIKHDASNQYFATRYDHLKKDSITVKPGQRVSAGEKIGEVGSSGRSTGPHLHFEVWGKTFYDPIDMWKPIAQRNSKFFPDTDSRTVEGKAARKLREQGVIGGFADGGFHGDELVTRAQAMKFLLRGRDFAIGNLKNNGKYSDLPNTAWFTKYIMKAVNKGFVQGYSDGSFHPDDPVLTADFLKMLTKTFALREDLPHGYTDVTEDDWFDRYAGVAQKYRLFPHRKNFVLEPQKKLTRNEMAVAIYQVMKLEDFFIDNN